MKINSVLPLLVISSSVFLLSAQVAQADTSLVPHAMTTKAASHVPGMPDLKYSHVTSSSTTLSWNAVYGATKYEIYRNGHLYSVTKNRYLIDKHLSPNTKYVYTIYAVNSHGRSNKKTIAVTTHYSAAPATPRNFKASLVSQTTVGLRWSPASRATTYTITKDGHKIGTTKSTSFNVKKLSAGTAYVFRIYAYNNVGDSKVSTLSVATASIPIQMGLKSTNIDQNSVSLSWNAVAGAKSYSLSRDGEVIYTGTNTSYIDHNLLAATSYSYSVYATLSNGNTSKSPINITTLNETSNLSGVTPGIVTSGSGDESWSNNGQDVTLNSLSFDLSNNLVPIQGQVNSSFRGDLVVVVDNSSETEQCAYSIPVHSDGSFSDTIVIPYYGTDDVSIGIPVDAPGQDFDINPNKAAVLEFNNPQASLSPTQMALLQSWMVNYNESSSILGTATQITESSTSIDAKIMAVSNWVSDNIKYNFPEDNQNEIAWHQATQTLQIGNGVCQDEAALAAAYLRSLGIPTRVVDGEAYDPDTRQDLGGHAWDQAWDGRAWIAFDPTWDQVYYQDSSIAAPATITDAWFDMNPLTFAKSHVQDASDPFGWTQLITENTSRN